MITYVKRDAISSFDILFSIEYEYNKKEPGPEIPAEIYLSSVFIDSVEVSGRSFKYEELCPFAKLLIENLWISDEEAIEIANENYEKEIASARY
jgi:hypothetical protein